MYRRKHALTSSPYRNVQVALHIITALIEKLPRDLPIYARYVLAIIETVLRSNDISLVEDSIETFETFCRNQDLANLATEQGLATKYREVVRTYAGFANPFSASFSSSTPVAIRWRNVGLRAIKGVVSSEGVGADGGASLTIILPVILENLYSPDEDVLVPLKAKLRESEKPEPEVPRNRRMSVNTVDTANGDPTQATLSTADNDRQAEMNARLLALRCLKQIIVTGSNRGQIRLAAAFILQFVSKQRYPRPAAHEQVEDQTQNGNWATSLIELIATWCPVQTRFVILVSAMDLLHATSPKEDALDTVFNILSVIDWLLKSSVNMIGLSVMDILYGLTRYIPDILSPPGPGGNKEKSDSPADLSPRRKSVLNLVEQCIGDLATHIYYGDQVADMMRAILRKFKPAPNQESAAPNSLATVHEGGGTLAVPKPENTESNGDKAQQEAFSNTVAKLSALRAVKAILVVANLRASGIAAESETRNQVGIHVWEGTQGLLRDPERDVRHAYADAFLSWLQLETNKQDLKVRVDTPKFVKHASKRESDLLDKATRRSTSVPGNSREIVALAAQSNFLRLLHLAVYDSAIEGATVETDVLLLHLVLANLIENLGVNAVQFGLPMVLKLQDDLFTSVDLGSFRARVHIGTLVHGYLLALTEKFDLESTHAGVEIRNEIEKRQSKGQWLTRIKLPPAYLDAIVDQEKVGNDDEDPSIALTPFRNVEGLVNGIDESYRQTITSPPQSPPSSPARGFNFPVLSYTSAPQTQEDNGLPSAVKEQMLSSWSRESCLAAVEKESAKALSIRSSRKGTLTRSQLNGISNGSIFGSTNQPNRRMSVPDISREASSRTPDPSSHRNSPVRMTHLRRVLSVNNDIQSGRINSLDSQASASTASIVSYSESLAGAYSGSEMNGDGESTKGQDEQRPSGDDGIETPRAAAAAALSGEKTSEQAQPALSRVNSEDIPPVPPIPSDLSIPGGFPGEAQRSVDRPATAPYAARQSSKKQHDASGAKALNRDKTRSSSSLAAGISDVFKAAQFDSDSALDSDQRDQLRKLLDGFLSSDGTTTVNGNHSASEPAPSKSILTGGHGSRRSASGGIGAPPY